MRYDKTNCEESLQQYCQVVQLENCLEGILREENDLGTSPTYKLLHYISCSYTPVLSVIYLRFSVILVSVLLGNPCPSGIVSLHLF
jgi:hypothetical protein